jgi:hypothetical protein
MRTLFLLLLLTLVGCGQQRDSVQSVASPRPRTAKIPFETLQTIPTFAFGGVYEAGIRSEGELAFRGVVTNMNALELFGIILSNGTTEAKLYALCGVRKLSPNDFEARVGSLEESGRVRTMRGCIVMDERVTDVVARIRTGDYDTFISETSH